MSKKESIEEYLARGGKVKKIPSQFKDENIRRANPSPNVVAVPLSMDDAAVLYGHHVTKDGYAEKKRLEKSKLDLSKLPDDLKKRFISKLKEKIESDNEE